MVKYHISANGEPAICKARFRPCPLSGQHYTDLAEAQTHADEAKHLTSAFGLTPEAARRVAGVLSTAELVAHREALLAQGPTVTRLNSGTMTFDELVQHREALLTQAKIDAVVSVEEEKRQPAEWQANHREKLRRAALPPRLNPGTMSFDELVANREALLAQAEADAAASITAEKSMPAEWQANKQAGLRRWLAGQQDYDAAPGRAPGWYAPELLVQKHEPNPQRDAQLAKAQLHIPDGTAELEGEVQRGIARQRLQRALSELGVHLNDTLPTAQSNRVIEALLGDQPSDTDFYLVASQLKANQDHLGDQANPNEYRLAVRLFDMLGFGAAVPAAERNE